MSMTLLKYDYLILGCSTWGAGEVQNDWREPLFDIEVDKPDFSGKTIAIFWPRRLRRPQQALCLVPSAPSTISSKTLGAKVVGEVSTEKGYTFEKIYRHPRWQVCRVMPSTKSTKATKTDQRIADWLEQLKP